MARKGANVGVIAGVVVGCVVVLALVVVTVLYLRNNPEKCESITRRFRNAKRSTQGAI